jgi:hypothetical protein
MAETIENSISISVAIEVVKLCNFMLIAIGCLILLSATCVLQYHMPG